MAGGGSTDGLGLPVGIKRTKEFQKKVDASIDLGVAWLRTLQRPDGSFSIPALRMFHVHGSDSLGPTALGVYALRACGAGFADPDVARGLQWLRERYDGMRKTKSGLDNYGVSLTVLALEAHWNGSETTEAGKGPYDDGDMVVRRRIPDADLAWLRELARWLEEAQTGDGGFSYWSPAGKNRTCDNSNAQYSLLALKAARRCGVEVRPEVFWKGAEYFLDCQERKGPEAGRYENAGVDEDGYGSGKPRVVGKDFSRGWGYVQGAPATGSMTAGGISSLVICRSELLKVASFAKKLEPQVQKGIRDGIAWLGVNFSVTSNPGPAQAPAIKELWHHYYLYGLERAGVMAGVPWMGPHDWYGEGVHHLLDGQRDNGSWHSSSIGGAMMPEMAMPGAAGNFLDTCFALLFLKRATFRVEGSAVATEAGDARLDLSGAADLDDNSFRSLFTAVFRRFARADSAERANRSRDFVQMGVRSIPALILLLDAPEESEREIAADALQRTTGRHGDFRADAPEVDRARAVTLWEEWWMTARATLRADAATGRFVAP
jgi:hypothetical protein